MFYKLLSIFLNCYIWKISRFQPLASIKSRQIIPLTLKWHEMHWHDRRLVGVLLFLIFTCMSFSASGNIFLLFSLTKKVNKWSIDGLVYNGVKWEKDCFFQESVLKILLTMYLYTTVKCSTLSSESTNKNFAIFLMWTDNVIVSYT